MVVPEFHASSGRLLLLVPMSMFTPTHPFVRSVSQHYRG